MFGFKTGRTTEAPARCEMCEHRKGLCQHNLFQRIADGGENVQHTSKACMEGQCEFIIYNGATITRRKVDLTIATL
jgi:hypothetical protein